MSGLITMTKSEMTKRAKKAKQMQKLQQQALSRAVEQAKKNQRLRAEINRLALRETALENDLSSVETLRKINLDMVNKYKEQVHRAEHEILRLKDKYVPDLISSHSMGCDGTCKHDGQELYNHPCNDCLHNFGIKDRYEAS